MQTLTAGDEARTTILFVDDTPAVATVSAKLLRRAGFRVLVAPDAARALQVVERERERIALIMADVRIPGLGGRELVSELRAHGVQAPALYISGDAAALASDYGDAAFLAKPWSFDELIEAVREVLGSPQASCAPDALPATSV